MDNLHHLAEAILSAVNDKNYQAARDLTQELLNTLEREMIDDKMREYYSSSDLASLLQMDLSDPLVIEAIAQKKVDRPDTFIEILEESRK